MITLKNIAAILVLLLVSGCSTPAQFQNMIHKEPIAGSFDRELEGQVEVSSVQGGSKTNPLWTSQISNDDFQKALEISLANNGLLSNDGRFDLKVTLLEVKQPMFGLDFEVVTKVSYIIQDRQTREVVLDEVIQVPFTATFGDAAIAITRLRLANEGSGRENIKKFLEVLAQLNIDPKQISMSNQ